MFGNKTKVTFYGHACLGLDFAGYSILIDPFFVGNPVARMSPSELHPNLILVTHGHQDHFGDTISIAGANKSIVVSSPEIANYCKAYNIETKSIHADEIFTPKECNIKIKAIKAIHNSIMQDGTYGGDALSYFITGSLLNLYFLGDTSYYQDMQQLEGRVDTAFVPIGDARVMSFEDVIDFVDLVKPRRIVPVHYNSLPQFTQDTEEFIKFVKSQVSVEILIMNPMDTLELDGGPFPAASQNQGQKQAPSSANLLGGGSYNSFFIQ